MVRLIGRFICSKKVVEHFWNVHISHVAGEGGIANSDINAFTGNVFAILVHYFEVADIGPGMPVRHTALIYCTDDMTGVFFNTILQSTAGLSYAGKVTIFSGQDHL